MEYAPITSRAGTYLTGVEYIIRLEARRDQMTVSVDNGLVFSASDARLVQGDLLFSASNGSVATFDDVNVWSFGP